MIYEYAVDPELFAYQNNLFRLLDNIGPAKGRMISSCPKKWLEAVNEVVNRSGSRGRQRRLVDELIIYLERHCLVKRRNLVWNKETWLLSAEEEHRVRPFKAIVSESNSETKEVIPLHNLNPHNELWNIPTEIRVQRSVESFVKAVRPFLTISKRLCFIDPHFQPKEPRYSAPFLSFLNELRSSNSLIETEDVQVHLSAASSSEANLYRSQILNLERELPRRMEVRFRIWQRNKEIFHNRYILSELGGLSFSTGLDTSRHTEAFEEIHIVNMETRDQLWDLFVEGYTSLSMLEDVTVTGN